MNIILIGYRCTGKTHVGRLLAGELQMAFLDTDQLIEEKTGMPIASYVSRYGWGNFRSAEREVVEAVAQQNNSVIATGGGVVVDPDNLSALKKNGWLVWLAATTAVIRERMALAQAGGTLRPALFGTDPLAEIETVLRDRMPLYEQASDLRLHTDGRTPEAVAQAIVSALPPFPPGATGRTC
jgi:shikimate kinase